MRIGLSERRTTFYRPPSTNRNGSQLASYATSRSLRFLKKQAGGAIYVIGGPALVSSLLNESFIDELRLIVHPIILGGGKAPFAGVRHRQTLELVRSEAGRSGRVLLTYRI